VGGRQVVAMELRRAGATRSFAGSSWALLGWRKTCGPRHAIFLQTCYDKGLSITIPMLHEYCIDTGASGLDIIKLNTRSLS